MLGIITNIDNSFRCIEVVFFVDKKSSLQIGGNIENALQGKFDINVTMILKEAWQKTLCSRFSINLGLLFIGLLAALVFHGANLYYGGFEVIQSDVKIATMVNLIVTLLILPFIASVEMMGVFHSVGMKTSPKLLFSFLNRASWLVLCGLLTSVLISIGLQLFVLPGIFLMVVFSLTLPLVIEKNLTPMQAIILSIKVLRFQWYRTFSLYLILGLSFTLAMLPFALLAGNDYQIIGIGFFIFCLSYLLPWFFNVKGILYREIFGLTLSTGVDALSLKNTSSEDTFSA